MIKDGTPRSFAYQQMVDALYTMHGAIAGGYDYDGVELSDSERKDVLRHVAKEHDRLLEKGKLDGIALSVAA